MKIKKVDRQKFIEILLKIKSQTDLLLYGILNDNDFPLQEDFEAIEEIEAEIFEIKKIIVKS